MAIAISVSDGAAVLALAIAIWSAVQTGRFNRRQNAFAETAERLNQLLIEREAADAAQRKGAELSANFVKIGKSDYRLKVFNRGPGSARNVRLEQLSGGHIGARELEQKFPLPLLERQQNIDFLVRVFLGSARRAHIKLYWEDDVSSVNEKELWLDVF